MNKIFSEKLHVSGNIRFVKATAEVVRLATDLDGVSLKYTQTLVTTCNAVQRVIKMLGRPSSRFTPEQMISSLQGAVKTYGTNEMRQ